MPVVVFRLCCVALHCAVLYCTCRHARAGGRTCSDALSFRRVMDAWESWQLEAWGGDPATAESASGATSLVICHGPLVRRGRGLGGDAPPAPM